ncbi:lysophospholipase L1-like esterase [Chelatococcus caeni]|uniref:Lysophospholipase L1-like esterase n=1 Tax=Chelatococcus caeni TaxID=1348468 RepID=A0A840C558_9HYPH|nr:SGNH/GDSL hydrolase family protein [Chelatococcus caeni]MBB4017537.1 lysophospholipase L1-like esterase [Chelatococcus caeni]
MAGLKGWRAAIIGTSLVQQNHFADERLIATSSRGWAAWAEVLSTGRLSLPVFHDRRVRPGWEPSNRPGGTRGFGGLNFGVSGQKVRDIEARLGDVLADRAAFDFIIVDAGTNDMMVEAKETIQAGRERICDRFVDAGCAVILLPILARGTEKWPAGGAERAKAQWINERSRAYARSRGGVFLFDWNEPWIDRASPFGVPRDGYSDDGTHFAPAGGYAVGKALAAYLAGLLPLQPRRTLSRDDRFDPRDNPLGNLCDDPFLIRAAAEGEGLLVETSHAVDVKAAFARRPDGLGFWQKLDIIGAGGDPGSVRLTVPVDVPAAALPAGGWMQASVEVEVGASPAWRGVTLRLAEDAPDGLVSAGMDPFRDGAGKLHAWPAEAWCGLIATPPLRPRPGGRPRLSLDILVANTGARPATLAVGGFELRAVADPPLAPAP